MILQYLLRLKLMSVIRIFFILVILNTSIRSLAAASPVFFTRHSIDDNFDHATAVHAIDMNNDGNMDILGAASYGDTIAWWQNDGNEQFSKHIIDDDFNGANAVHAVDLDQDGDVDVLGTATYADDIAWWENDGSENFTKHIISGSFDGANTVHAADLNGNGHLDIISTAYNGDDIAWWENDGSQNFTRHTLDYYFDGAISISIIDVDNDSDEDIVAAARNDGIAWWQNDGAGGFSKHVVDGDFFPAYCVHAGDLDSDGDIDIIGGSDSDDIAWWENDGSENFAKHTIALESTSAAKSLFMSDLDNDGDTDFVGAINAANDIRWWENDGNQAFTEHLIDHNFDGAASVFVTDINGDTALDIVGAASYADDIRWWEQVSDAPVVCNPVSGSVSGEWAITNCPYTVVDELTIEIGQSLTIQPGVEVQFAGSYAFTVNGDLLINGTETNPVIFTSFNSSPQPGDWKGIKFANSGEGDSIQHIQVEYAETGIAISADGGEASPRIQFATVTHSKSAGIVISADGDVGTATANPEIINSVITENGGSGIDIDADAGSFSATAQPEIINSTISNNVDYGIDVYGDGGSDDYKDGRAEPIIRGNVVTDNGDDGIYLYGSGGSDVHTDGVANGQIDNNIIANNARYGIYCRGVGGGVRCFPGSCITGSSSPQIAGNVIRNNVSAGIYISANGSSSNGYSNRGYASPQVVNNRIINNGGDGIKTFDYDSYDVVNPKIINNTIIGNANAGIQSGNEVDSGFDIYNNHIISNAIGLAAHTDEIPDLGYNNLWNNGADFNNYPTTYGDLTNSNTNGDPSDSYNNIFQEPYFVDAANGDYHLLIDSPAIDAGINHANGPEDDMDGDKRPSGNHYDIGADEYLIPDTTAPVTTATFEPLVPTGTNGWYLETVIVSLEAVDNESGVENTYYRINHDSNLHTYTSSFEVNVSGATEITYYSVDKDENTESEHTVVIYVDMEQPTSTVVSASTSDTNSITVAWTANDAFSGINQVTLWYQINGNAWVKSNSSNQGKASAFEFTPSAEGSYCFATQATDIAGNLQLPPTGTGTFCVDYIPSEYIIFLPIIINP